MIRLQCEAREDYYRTQLGLKYEMEKRDAEIESLSAEKLALSEKGSKPLYKEPKPFGRKKFFSAGH